MIIVDFVVPFFSNHVNTIKAAYCLIQNELLYLPSKKIGEYSLKYVPNSSIDYMKKLFFALISASALFVSCESGSEQQTVNGNGTLKTESREGTTFTAIQSNNDFFVIYKKAKTTSISVTADENLLPYIQTELEGSTLTIRPAQGYNIQPSKSGSRVIVRVSSPSVSSLSLIGSGLLSADTISGTSMDITINGSGTVGVGYANGTTLNGTIHSIGLVEVKTKTSVTQCNIDGSGSFILTGSSTTLNINIDGVGSVNAYSSPCQQSQTTIKGSGECYLSVSTKLDASIKGTGLVYYKGNPVLTSNVEGTGKVIKQE
jgi:hypothetical protein